MITLRRNVAVLATTAAAAAAGLGGPVATARAGTYTVLSCHDRAGAPAALSDAGGGWVAGSTGGAGLDSVDRCGGDPAHGFLATVSGVWPHPVGSAAWWRFVAPRGSDDDAPDLIGDPAAIQLGEESGGRRGTLIPDHGRPGIIEHRAILGDDGLEELEAVTDAAQLEEGASRDENEPQPSLPGALEGFPYPRADPIVGCQGTVEIERQRLEEHACRRIMLACCVGGARSLAPRPGKANPCEKDSV